MCALVQCVSGRTIIGMSESDVPWESPGFLICQIAGAVHQHKANLISAIEVSRWEANLLALWELLIPHGQHSPFYEQPR